MAIAQFNLWYLMLFINLIFSRTFVMTQLLEKAFSEASMLPELQQNILARWIIDELLAEKNGIYFFLKVRMN